MTQAGEKVKEKGEEFTAEAEKSTPKSARHAAKAVYHVVRGNPLRAAAAGGPAGAFFLGWWVGRR